MQIHFRTCITEAIRKKLPLCTNDSNVQSTPPLQSMGTAEEPDKLSNFLGSDVKHHVVTVAEDLNDIPIINRLARKTKQW